MKSRFGYFSKLTIAVLGAALLFAFQNCSFTDSGLQSAGYKSKSSSSNIKGSGGTRYEIGGEEGYEGKASYGARTPAGMCEDGKEYDSEVEVDHDKGVAVYSRYNCQDIPLGRIVASDSLDIMPHNKDNFMEGDKVYERTDDPNMPAGELFGYCRGFNSYGTVLVDAIIRVNEEGDYFGRVVGGHYSESGQLLGVRDTGWELVKRWSTPDHPDNAYFNFYNDRGERELHIGFKSGIGQTKASMHYWIIPEGQGSWGSIWNFPCVRLKD